MQRTTDAAARRTILRLVPARRETTLDRIHRLEDERLSLYYRACRGAGDRDRLAEINADLKNLWDARRVELARRGMG